MKTKLNKMEETKMKKEKKALVKKFNAVSVNQILKKLLTPGSYHYFWRSYILFYSMSKILKD